jgi:hypothetical protein
MFVNNKHKFHAQSSQERNGLGIQAYERERKNPLIPATRPRLCNGGTEKEGIEMGVEKDMNER